MRDAGDLLLAGPSATHTREGAATAIEDGHRASHPRSLALLALVVAHALIALDLDVPVLRPVVALTLFVVVPTYVLRRRGVRLTYAGGATLLGLILGGLVVDTALGWVGVDHPLAPAPLAIACLLVNLALLRWRREIPLVLPGEARAALAAVLAARFALAPTLAALALLLSVVGAVRLNNGTSGGVAIAAVVASGAALLAQLAAHDRRRDGWVLGLVAAGLLLATSLRGWTITGHDIQGEFLAFRLTDAAQNWDVAALQSAYNACLSVTVLPTVLTQASGLSGEIVFTVLLQLVFAAVPVLTYVFARQFVAPRMALAAGIFTLAFPTFFTDMPYLVRQEIAFFFVALVLLAATDAGVSRRTARALVLAFGLGVILSHYSTTYVLVMALVAALVGIVLTRSRSPLVLVHPLVVAGLLAMTLAWAGPITGTGGHAREVLATTIDTILGQEEAGPGSSDTSYWLLARDETTPRERMDSFVSQTLEQRDAEIPTRLQVIRDPGAAVLRPELHAAAATPVKVVCGVLMQVILLLGLFRLLRTRGHGLPTELLFVTWGSMAALGLIVLVPNLSVQYGVFRAFQQTLLVVAPVMAIGALWLLRKPMLAMIAPVALLVVLAGTQQRIALENAGVYYDRFFATDSAMAGLRWLGVTDHADRTNERIIANRNLNVRLLALSGNRAPVSDRLFPTLLSRDAYVFVDGQILDRGESSVFHTGDVLTYTYPLRSLDRQLDLLYDAPQARVYR